MINHNENLKKIFGGVLTREELDIVLQALEEAKRKIYKSGAEKIPEILGGLLPRELVGDLWDAASGRMGGNKPSEFMGFIEDFKSEAGKLRPLKLYVSFKPSEIFLESVKKWIGENVGGGILLEAVEDKEILGGARIVFRGKFKDATLSRFVDDYFASASSDILAELKF